MRNPFEVVGSPNRVNIFYEKVFRVCPDIDAYENILKPIAENLLVQKVDYPLTVVYLNLKWCGFAYRLFERILRSEQYYPQDAHPIPENRLFSQFHSPQTVTMKEQILKELASTSPKLSSVWNCCNGYGNGYTIYSVYHPHWTAPYCQRIYAGNR